MDERVLVTGATGFTGGHLILRLISMGLSPRALVRRGSNYKGLEEKGCEIFLGDLATGGGIDDAVNGVDKVYHIGAAFRVEGVPKQYFWDVNVEGTRKLLDASLKYGVKRFVHCSTVGVHGEIKEPPATEDTPFNPGDHYQQSKLEGEQLALEYYKKGLGVVVFRPVGIYGPGDTRFLKLFKPIAKGRWFIVGTGENLYHLTYIDDLVNGIILCGVKEGIEGEVFILGGEGYTTVCELGFAIADVLGVNLKVIKIPVFPARVLALLCEKLFPLLNLEPPLYRRRLDFFLKDRAFDISKARNRLDYKPRIPLDEGIRMTADWYRGHGFI